MRRWWSSRSILSLKTVLSSDVTEQLSTITGGLYVSVIGISWRMSSRTSCHDASGLDKAVETDGLGESLPE